MYKFCITRFTKRLSPKVSIIPKQMTVQPSMRLCSFCNYYHRRILKCSIAKHHQVRCSSTSANMLNDLTIDTKIKPKAKKYTELLTVTNNVTCRKKAEVRNINASNLSKLMDLPDAIKHNSETNMQCMEGKFHTLDNNQLQLNTKELLKGDTNVLNENVMIDANKLLNKETFNLKQNQIKTDSISNTKLTTPVTSKKSLKIQRLNTTPKQTMNKVKQKKDTNFQKHYNKYIMQDYIHNLLAHIQVYISCGLLNRANTTLMKYRKYIQNKQKLHSDVVEVYNTVLGAYASKKKTTKVLELYDIIKKDSLIPTPQTYACIFDALARDNKNRCNTELFKTLKNEMDRYSISFDDIFNKSYFKSNEQENILELIRTFTPNYKPSYTRPSNTNQCKLLNDLYAKSKVYESPTKGLMSLSELKDLLRVQLENEYAIDVSIQSIETSKGDVKRNEKSMQKIEAVERSWRKAALAGFERNLKSLKQKESRSHNNLMILYPFLEVLDKEEYVNAILKEVENIAKGSETYSTSLKSLYTSLGKYIYKKYEMQTKKKYGVLDKLINIYTKYLQWYLHSDDIRDLQYVNYRMAWQYFEQQEAMHGPSLHYAPENWSMDVIVNIGKFLYNIILNDIILQPDIMKGLNEKRSIPAFYTLFRNRGTFLSEQIKPHPFVSKLYKEYNSEILTFNSLVVPLHTPPRPWTSIYTGGYIITKADFTRIPNYTEDPWKKLQETPVEQLFPIFDSLNQLGSIPWKVNTSILDIVIDIFQAGGSVELNVPLSVSALTPPVISKDATAEEKQKATIAMSKYKQRKYEVYSLWCDTLYKLSIANHFRNKVFWLPHNLDFRGRVYPVPPHLNHLSSDLGRALLLFANGKPLGPNGLNWLKLHVINLTSFKKGTSVEERIKFADENMDNILDSAAKPLTGKMWWAKSEEPWQTLAACMEIAKALQSPNVEEYVSTFPVHQDGSCNGLQHYAALGRDQIGAESVNLYPFDAPRDVYSAVAAIVEERRQADAKNDVKIAQVLEGFIKRKVIKQTIMTTVYGVTKFGAKLQIAKQLNGTSDFPEKYIMHASLYLTENTFHSLRTMFKSAREIQDWFTVCARIISSICNEKVEWVTPLGLPIIQSYSKQLKSCNTYVQSKMKPNSMKQKNAFAPNFIHSLDSTHMMLTSLHCGQENITFVSVHDCFWTHPSTVEAMNRICREQFVALHSQPILEDLAKFFIERYSPIYENLPKNKHDVEEIRVSLSSVPATGSFDIKQVLKSTYFFN